MADETLSADSELETATPNPAETPTDGLDNQQPTDAVNDDESVNLQAAEQDGGTEEKPEEGVEAEAEEFEEIEYEGKTFTAPKALKEKLSQLDNMNAHFTRTNQANAETKRELEQMRERAVQQLQASEEELGHRATLQNVTAQLEQYANVNWQQLEQEDPIGANQHWRYYQQLKDAKTEATSKITEAEQQRTQEAEREFATRKEQTLEYARTKIPGWTQETHQKVLQFMDSQNVPIDVAKQFWGPQFYDLLHKAMIGDNVLKKPARSAAPTPTPLTVVSGKSAPGARKSLAEMDMEEYVAARKKQQSA